MIKNKVVIYSGLFLVAAIAAFVFISTGNDHKECSSIKQITTDKNGNRVISEKHTCKEKYSF